MCDASAHGWSPGHEDSHGVGKLRNAVRDNFSGRRERVNLQRQSVFFERVRDDFGEQFLFKKRNVGKFRPDAAFGKFVNRFTRQRQVIFIRQLHEHPKFVADINPLVPFGETAAETDLRNLRLHRFALFRITNRRNIE